MWKSFLVMVSAVNLFFLDEWRELVVLHLPATAYYRMKPPAFTLFYALLLDILAAGVVMFGISRLSVRGRRFGESRLFGCLLVLPFFVAVGVLRHVLRSSWDLPISSPLLLGLVWLLPEMLLVVAVVQIARGRSRLQRIVPGVLLVLSPLPLVLSVSIALASAETSATTSNPDTFTSATVKSKFRVVWVIFDEWDEEATLPANRPPNLPLPETDSLRTTTFFGSRVYPAGDLTDFSIPALLTGRPVENALPRGKGDLDVYFSDGKAPVSFKDSPTIFDSLRKKDLRAAILGWHHPYAELFGDKVAYCHWETCPLTADKFPENRPGDPGLAAAMFYHWDHAAAMPVPLRLVGLDQRYNFWQTYDWQVNRKLTVERVRRLLDDTFRVLERSDIDFMFVHLPLPHPPGIFDRKRDVFTIDPPSNYFDNLRLVDIVVGQMLHRIDRQPNGIPTAVVLSSDHPYRTRLWGNVGVVSPEARKYLGTAPRTWIPFFLKLPGQRSGLVYNKPFNAVLSRELVEQVIGGKIRTYAEAAAWIDANRLRYPLSPNRK
jgi:Sulfatase